MSLRRLWTIAYRDLGRNRRRTVLTALAVALGLALLIMMNGLIAGVMDDAIQNAVRLQTGHVQVRAASYDEDKLDLQPKDLLSAPADVVAQADGIAGVASASPELWAGAILTTPEESVNLRLIGVDPNSSVDAPVRGALVDGLWVADDDRTGVVIGKHLADGLGIEVGSKVNLGVANADGQLQEGTFVVRGLFSTDIPTYDDGTLLMPLSKAQAIVGATNRASAVVIVLDDQNQADRVAAQLQAPGRAVLTWRELNQLMIQTAQVATGYYVLFYGIVILVVAVVIANTLLMAVFERVREMGILAALGMRGRQIMGMFLLEAGTLGLAGIAGGIVLGCLGVLYLARVGIHIGSEMASAAGSMALGTTMYAHFVPSGILWLSFWMIAIILIASLYPAWFAARLQPVDALRRS